MNKVLEAIEAYVTAAIKEHEAVSHVKFHEASSVILLKAERATAELARAKEQLRMELSK